MNDTERARFLQLLRETGNRRVAAEAIGIDPRLMDQRRQHDAELDREWKAAVAEADRRLAGRTAAAGSNVVGDEGMGTVTSNCPPGTRSKLNTIRRGRNGRLQLVAAGEARWSDEVEDRFKEALRATGNVRAAARAVGFHESAIWQRRRQWPAFADMLEQMLEEAEVTLEFRIASMGSNMVAGNRETWEMGTVTGNCPLEPLEPLEPVPFDADFAMRFLKWREEKRRGRGRWAPQARPPSIEEVTERIVRRVEAIKRYRARENGDSYE